MSEILVVDDEPGIRDVLHQILEDEGHDVRLAENAAQANKAMQEKTPDLVLLDVWMPDRDGLTLLKEWASQGPLKAPVVMMSGHGTIKDAMAATRLGAFDFLEKPISFKPLLEVIKRALASRVAGRVLEESLTGLGSGQRIVELAQRLRQAPVDAVVFLAAEPGAGAELCARFLHIRDTPWLAPSEMGPLADNPIGWLQEAKGGVLFLAEIGRLSAMQQKGLQLLLARRGEFGVRVVCASSDNLREKEGYSKELYTTLTRSAFLVPPLRDHAEDIPEIARDLLSTFVQSQGLKERSFSPAALSCLGSHALPGNLDELRGLVEDLATSGDTPTIEEDAVRTRLGHQFTEGLWEPLFDRPFKEACDDFERIYLQALLARHHGKVSEAAKQAGLERTYLYRKLRVLSITVGKTEEADT